MMRKASILLCTALLIGVLAGCGSSNDKNAAGNNNPVTTEAGTNNTGNATAEQGKYQDGVYYAAAEPDAKTGWQYYVTLTVSGGNITDVTWNGLNANVGVDKVTYSAEGKYGMVANGGAQAEWHEQAAKAEQYLIEIQDPKAITLDENGNTDAISGVTVHVNELFDLADQALTAGPVQAGPYKDGTYHIEGDQFDDHSGWKDTVDVVIAAGKIVKVNFDAVNEAGESKKQNSVDGKYGMVEKGGSQAEWHEQAITAEAYLVDKQDPASTAFNEDGKTDAISGVSISLQSYFDLVTKVLEQAK